MADFTLVPGERLDKQYQYDILNEDRRMVGVLYWTGDRNTPGTVTDCWALALPHPEFKRYGTWRNVIALPEADEAEDFLAAFILAAERHSKYLTEEVDT